MHVYPAHYKKRVIISDEDGGARILNILKSAIRPRSQTVSTSTEQDSSDDADSKEYTFEVTNKGR